MKADVVLAGVGGQGVLTAAAIVAEAARREGLEVKQTEVHGMAQRGGAVQASLRIASEPIASPTVPFGDADLVLGLEPLEALRCAEMLGPDGLLVTSADAVASIPGYPPIDEVHELIRALGGHLVEANLIAKEVGSPRSANVVMIGAASALLDLPTAVIEGCIQDWFAAGGTAAVDANLAAFRAGRAVVPVPG